MVRNALPAVGRLHRKTGILSVLICSVALLAGCGGSKSSKRERADLPLPALPVSLQLATCTDWRKGTVAQRRGTIVKLSKFAGGQVGSSGGIQNGPVIDDALAYRILNEDCSKALARGFQLYKIYVRAAGFVGRQRSAGPFG